MVARSTRNTPTLSQMQQQELTATTQRRSRGSRHASPRQLLPQPPQQQQRGRSPTSRPTSRPDPSAGPPLLMSPTSTLMGPNPPPTKVPEKQPQPPTDNTERSSHQLKSILNKRTFVPTRIPAATAQQQPQLQQHSAHAATTTSTARMETASKRVVLHSTNAESGRQKHHIQQQRPRHYNSHPNPKQQQQQQQHHHQVYGHVDDEDDNEYVETYNPDRPENRDYFHHRHDPYCRATTAKANRHQPKGFLMELVSRNIRCVVLPSSASSASDFVQDDDGDDGIEEDEQHSFATPNSFRQYQRPSLASKNHCIHGTSTSSMNYGPVLKEKVSPANTWLSKNNDHRDPISIMQLIEGTLRCHHRPTISCEQPSQQQVFGGGAHHKQNYRQRQQYYSQGNGRGNTIDEDDDDEEMLSENGPFIQQQHHRYHGKQLHKDNWTPSSHHHHHEPYQYHDDSPVQTQAETQTREPEMQLQRQKRIFADGIRTILIIMKDSPDSADSQCRACQLLADFCVESRLFADLAVNQGALELIQQYSLFPFRKLESVQTMALQAMERLLLYTSDPTSTVTVVDEALIVSAMKQHATSAQLMAAASGVLSVLTIYNAEAVLEAGGMEVLSTAFRLFRNVQNPYHRDIRGHVRCTIPHLLAQRAHAERLSSSGRNPGGAGGGDAGIEHGQAPTATRIYRQDKQQQELRRRQSPPEVATNQALSPRLTICSRTVGKEC